MPASRCSLGSAHRIAALAAFTLLAAAEPARADDYRRPGLEGKWSRRHLTAPMNSLRIVAGPGQPMLLGQRLGEQIAEGGPQFRRLEGSAGAVEEWWLRGGVAFGLTEDWEAGALFLPFKFAPDFEFSNITVFVTRGFRFEDFDFGIRLSFQTPSTNADDLRVWNLNPGIPLLYRAGPLRVDAAVLVPFATRDWTIGVNVPVRGTLSLSPRWFLGLESGFVEPRFDVAGDTSVPLAALVGYTELFGNKLADFTAQFAFDRFWTLGPQDGQDAVDPGTYRIGLGVVFHSLVK